MKTQIIIDDPKELKDFILNCLDEHEAKKQKRDNQVWITINKARPMLGKEGRLASYKKINSLIDSGKIKCNADKSRILLSSIHEFNEVN